MSLIERYVHAVTKHLPQSQRAEVGEELRASIEDMAADRAKGSKPKEADIEKVLVELGDPTVMAGNYTGTKRYLIGPKWFDTYWGVLKQILYFVPAIVVCIMLVVNFVTTDRTWIENIIHAFGAGIGAAIQIAFWTTATFFVLERSGDVNPKDIMDIKAKEKPAWTPSDLPLPPKKRQIPAIEAWVSVGLMVVGIAWVALSPFWNTRDGHTLFDPNLAQFWAPAFFILASLSTIHKAFQAHIGNWTTPLVATNIMLGLAGIAFTIALVSQSPVINPEFLQTLPMKDGINIAASAEWARWTVAISAVAFIATYIWEMVDSIIKNRQLVKK